MVLYAHGGVQPQGWLVDSHSNLWRRSAGCPRRSSTRSGRRRAAEWRKNKLKASEYDETAWSARTWMAFVTQRLSVASQLSMAQEAAEALGLSVAADPRAQ
eukprot:scaffold113000_cov57-Phaeocystis_antarctica.AAC.4